MTRRTERINDLLREELSDLLRRQVKDPRLGGLVTVTEVDVSVDLRHARVFVSVMGSDEEREDAFKALEAARPFLRRELGKRLSIRRTPDLSFRRDDSLERGARLLALIEEASPVVGQDGLPADEADLPAGSPGPSAEQRASQEETSSS
jgi:ribosome-binding factor A